MSVRIPIEADAARVVKQLQDMQRAIERTGQSAKDLAKVDLSHPELKHLADDIRKVQDNLKDLLNARGSTAASARKIYDGSGANLFGPGGLLLPETWQRLRPDGNQGTSQFVNAMRYLTAGSRWNLPQAGAPAPGGGWGGIPLPQMQMPTLGGAAGGAFSAMRAGAGWMLGMAGVGALAGMASRAVSQAQEEAVANDTLMRTLRDLDTDFAGLRRSVRDASTGLGLTYQEAQRLSLAWVRATNETDGEVTTRNMRFAAGAARSLGLDPAAMVGGMGHAAFMGQDPRRFAVLLAETMRDSGMTGQGEQVMGQLLRWQEGFTRNMSDADSIRLAAGMYSTLSSSGNPSLRGQFGAALMDQMNGALSQGGAAGDASMHLTYRAMARAGVTDPYQIQHILAGGMFGRIGANGPTVLEASMGEINRLYAGLPDYQRWHAMGRHLGINPRQAQAIEGAMGRGANLGRLGEQLSALGIAPGSINPTALGEVAEIAGSSDLGEWRRRVQRNSAIPQADRDRLGTMEGEDLRREMIRLLARDGGSRTDGEQVRETQAQMANALTAAGTGLIPVLNDMRDVLSNLGQGIGTLSETLGDVYSAYVQGNPEARERLQRRRDGGGTPAAGNAVGEVITGEEQEARARFIYEEGLRRGLTPEQASGMVAQARAESNFRSGARGDGGRAHGVFQHHPSRRAAMERQFGLAPGGYSTSSFEDQVRMSYWELLEGPERAAGEALRRSQTAAEAGGVLSDRWERPGATPQARANEAARRSAWSAQAHDRLRQSRPQALPAMPGQTRPELPAPTASEVLTPGATPAPEQTRTRPDGQMQTFNIAPLRVIHESTAGDFLGEEVLPVARGGDAVPRGLA